MLGDAICVLHTQNPRALQAEPSKPRFRNRLLSLVSVYWLLGLGLISGTKRLLGLGISLARALEILLGLGLNPRTETERRARSACLQAWLYQSLDHIVVPHCCPASLSHIVTLYHRPHDHTASSHRIVILHCHTASSHRTTYPTLYQIG